MSKKNLNFKSISSLESVERVIKDAAEALKNPAAGLADSAISEVLSGALGAGVGGGLSFAALYGLGTVGLSAAGMTSALATAGALVGGGMAAGVFVLAAPVAALAGGGVWLAAKRNQRRLVQAKERMLQEAIRMRDAIVSELGSTVEKSEDRIQRLTALNTLLQQAVKDLKADLAA